MPNDNSLLDSYGRLATRPALALFFFLMCQGAGRALCWGALQQGTPCGLSGMCGAARWPHNPLPLIMKPPFLGALQGAHLCVISYVLGALLCAQKGRFNNRGSGLGCFGYLFCFRRHHKLVELVTVFFVLYGAI